MNYLFVSIMSMVVMSFTTIMVALLNTTVGQLVLTIIAAWVAKAIFGVSVADIPAAVYEEPATILDYIW